MSLLVRLSSLSLHLCLFRSVSSPPSLLSVSSSLTVPLCLFPFVSRMSLPSVSSPRSLPLGLFPSVSSPLSLLLYPFPSDSPSVSPPPSLPLRLSSLSLPLCFRFGKVIIIFKTVSYLYLLNTFPHAEQLWALEPASSVGGGKSANSRFFFRFFRDLVSSRFRALF
jgi:hypothetical protein